MLMPVAGTWPTGCLRGAKVAAPMKAGCKVGSGPRIQAAGDDIPAFMAGGRGVMNDRTGKPAVASGADQPASPIFVANKSTQMADMNTAGMATPSARPTLLTVICILSFIMGAWGIISAIQNLTTDQTAVVQEAREKMEEARAQLCDQADGLAGRMMDSGMEIAEKAAANAKPIGISGIILSLLSLFGVWQMWNLKKSGFWLYLLAAIGGLVVPLIFLGGSMMAVASVGVVGFFSLIFIILYAVNLKYMH